MEMYYLLLALANSSVILPSQYPKEQCETLRKEWINSKAKGIAYCVQAPSKAPDTLSEVDRRFPNTINECTVSVPNPYDHKMQLAGKAPCVGK